MDIDVIADDNDTRRACHEIRRFNTYCAEGREGDRWLGNLVLCKDPWTDAFARGWIEPQGGACAGQSNGLSLSPKATFQPTCPESEAGRGITCLAREGGGGQKTAREWPLCDGSTSGSDSDHKAWPPGLLPASIDALSSLWKPVFIQGALRRRQRLRRGASIVERWKRLLGDMGRRAARTALVTLAWFACGWPGHPSLVQVTK